MKKRWRVMCLLSFWEYDLCRVLNKAELTIALGQSMVDGHTRNLVNRPAMPYPISWEERQIMIS